MKKEYILILLFCFLFCACSKGYSDENTTGKLIFSLKSADGRAVENAFLVLSSLDENRIVRLGEGYSDIGGRWEFEYSKDFSGNITVVAPNYEPCKETVEYETGFSQEIAITLESSTSLSVLSYNILEGLKNSEAKKAKFAEWVQKYSPDIVLLQELNHFTEKSLKVFARTYGHSNAYIVKENGYPTGITSKYPIANVQKITNGQTHGYIHAECQGIHFFIIHLSPRELNTRITEIKQIIRHIQSLPAGAKVLVAGDFNSYNAYDEKAYGPTFVEERKKFPPRAEVDYTVTNSMLDADFKDAFTLFSDGHFKPSIPVRTNEYDPNRGCRYDYIFLNENLANSCIYSDILREKETNTLSDHYPVYIRLQGFK
ncbi:endonuclease/exonuclease/phosphatase family protein [Bacteroides sp.]